jgi:hypothetical protein
LRVRKGTGAWLATFGEALMLSEIRRAAVCAVLFFALPGAGCAETLAQLDALLASSPKIVREKPPASAAKLPRYVSVRGVNGSTGWIDPSLVTDGFLANGQRVTIVPIDSGGSGGVFTALLFTQIGRATRFVGTLPSPAGHLGVSLEGGRIVIRTPVYGASDPNCCPSALHYERATLHGTRLVTEDRWDVKLAH